LGNPGRECIVIVGETTHTFHPSKRKKISQCSKPISTHTNIKSIFIHFLFPFWGAMESRPLLLSGLLCQPRTMMMISVQLSVDRLAGETEALRKRVPVPLRPLQIPHVLTRAAAVGSRRITAWPNIKSVTLLVSAVPLISNLIKIRVMPVFPEI
jgi:hypothetical protein